MTAVDLGFTDENADESLNSHFQLIFSKQLFIIYLTEFIFQFFSHANPRSHCVMTVFGSFLLLRSQDPFPFKQPIRIRYCQNLYEDEIIRVENIAPERKIELVKLIWSEVKNWPKPPDGLFEDVYHCLKGKRDQGTFGRFV